MSTYTCDQCGVCCRTFPIFASAGDAAREPRIGAETLELPFHLQTPSWTFQLYPLPFHQSCCFLDGRNRCDIYATRPNGCQAFPAGSDQCQEARRRHGLAVLEPDRP